VTYNHNILCLYSVLYFENTLGMQANSPQTPNCGGTFKKVFRQFIGRQTISTIVRACGPARRRPPKLSAHDLIMALIFHCLQGCGTLAENIRMLTGKRIAKSRLSQRLQNLPWEVFTSIMEVVLRPRASEEKHPQAFYKGWRLVAIDGTQFSVSNTPQILSSLTKAASRRMKAAFAKLGAVLLVELGTHNPLAAAIGKDGDSEQSLAKELIGALPEKSILIADRLYGVGAFLVPLTAAFAKRSGHFLVRVSSNLKPKLLKRFKDGSVLVEIKPSKGTKKLQAREIRGRVRRAHGKWVDVRFWTSLVDCKAYPAKELLALYARRWEQEIVYKQIKVDMRQAELLRSHTVETAAQEVAALILAHAILAEQRMGAADLSQGEVLRISFGKTLTMVKSLWVTLAAAGSLLSPEQVAAMTSQVMRLIAQYALPPRRKRSCPRAVRQPIGSWPRLTKNTYSIGGTEYELTEIVA
jgi:hypothetical protein